MLTFFELNNQVTFLEEEAVAANGQTAFYIEENISDINHAIELCELADCNIKSKLRKAFSFDDICDFWQLISDIVKQREVGYAISDIEYIFKKGIEKGYALQLERASDIIADLEDPEDPFVIVGRSEIGLMYLYKELSFLEYTFYIEYNRKSRFAKKTVKGITHWHPRGLHAALDDMIAFMNSDRYYFKKLKINIA